MDDLGNGCSGAQEREHQSRQGESECFLERQTYKVDRAFEGWKPGDKNGQDSQGTDSTLGEAYI